MANTPRKTFPELQALSAPLVDSDVVAVYRTPGPAKRTTASVLKTYAQTGLGTMATQNANAVAITGGSITGITDLAVADGGTGASTAADARTNLAVVGTAALAASGGSALVGYIPTGTGATATTVQAKLRGQAISTADWGITADSNGTTGNGTDWTTQLQALVTYARANGRNIWVPAKPGFFIRFTGTINFEGAQTKMEVIGESNFDSAFFADFTSTSAIAAFSNNASSGSRSYVAWRNFRLLGRSDTTSSNTVRGIYSNWGGEFTEFESVFVAYFYDNVVISNDYNLRVSSCLFWYAKNDNLAIGYDISGASGACNNVHIEGTHLTYAGRYGGLIYACRALNVSGGGAEANAQGNLFLDLVYGGSITGYYMEYNSAEAGTPTFQLRFRNCVGCTVNGLSVSAFDNAGNPVVYVDEGNADIILNGLAIEQSGADTSAVGVLVRGSAGVAINGFFDGLTTGIRITEGARITITNSNILCTTPVSTDANGGTIVWQDAIDSQVTASVSSINALTVVNIVRTTLDRNVLGETKMFFVGASAANLASAGTKTLIDAELLSEQWRITGIMIGVNDGFAGGGGDRNIQVRTASNVYTTLPAASIQVYGTPGVWGSTPVPWGASETNLVPTPANGNLYAQYSGGSADYSAGSVVFTITATRIA